MFSCVTLTQLDWQPGSGLLPCRGLIELSDSASTKEGEVGCELTTADAARTPQPVVPEAVQHLSTQRMNDDSMHSFCPSSTLGSSIATPAIFILLYALHKLQWLNSICSASNAHVAAVLDCEANVAIYFTPGHACHSVEFSAVSVV